MSYRVVTISAAVLGGSNFESFLNSQSGKLVSHALSEDTHIFIFKKPDLGKPGKAVKLSGRTINGLKNYHVTQPEEMNLRELLAIPGIGIEGVTALARRIYGHSLSNPPNWPELE